MCLFNSTGGPRASLRGRVPASSLRCLGLLPVLFPSSDDHAACHFIPPPTFPRTLRSRGRLRPNGRRNGEDIDGRGGRGRYGGARVAHGVVEADLPEDGAAGARWGLWLAGGGPVEVALAQAVGRAHGVEPGALGPGEGEGVGPLGFGGHGLHCGRAGTYKTGDGDGDSSVKGVCLELLQHQLSSDVVRCYGRSRTN